MREHEYFVYIMASKSRVLYTGMTNNLSARVLEHKSDRIEGFTKLLRVHRLVYFESYNYVRSAIARGKEIKHWVRQRRVALIESMNPTWEDLAEKWFTRQRLADPNAMIYDASSIQTLSRETKRPFCVPQTDSEQKLHIWSRPGKGKSFASSPNSSVRKQNK